MHRNSSVRHMASRWSRFGAFARRAPYASAALIVLVGLYTGWLGCEGICHSYQAQATFWALMLPA